MQKHEKTKKVIKVKNKNKRLCVMYFIFFALSKSEVKVRTIENETFFYFCVLNSSY
jgi:hypothetical protein